MEIIDFIKNLGREYSTLNNKNKEEFLKDFSNSDYSLLCHLCVKHLTNLVYSFENAVNKKKKDIISVLFDMNLYSNGTEIYYNNDFWKDVIFKDSLINDYPNITINLLDITYNINVFVPLSYLVIDKEKLNNKIHSFISSGFDETSKNIILKHYDVFFSEWIVHLCVEYLSDILENYYFDVVSLVSSFIFGFSIDSSKDFNLNNENYNIFYHFKSDISDLYIIQETEQ